MSKIEYPDLEPLFRPKSIAIVGASASEDPTAMAAMPLRHAVEQGYKGKLYPVNPQESQILGLQTYSKIADIPGPVEFATIVVPPPAVPGIVDECIAKGVKAAQIITAGFREVGEEGRFCFLRRGPVVEQGEVLGGVGFLYPQPQDVLERGAATFRRRGSQGRCGGSEWFVVRRGCPESPPVHRHQPGDHGDPTVGNPGRGASGYYESLGSVVGV